MSSRALVKAGKHITRQGKKKSLKDTKKSALKESLPAVQARAAHIVPNIPPEIKEMLESFNSRLQDPMHLSPENVMFSVDPSLEGFFSRNEISLPNFNKLMKVFAQQGKLVEAQEAMTKVKLLGVYPDSTSYSLLIQAASRAGDLDATNKMFDMISNKLPEYTGVAYTSLMQVYSKKKDPVTIQALIRQKEEAGFLVTATDYTILIDCLNKCNRQTEALKLYKSLHVDKDEFLMITAISSCSKTYEAEYALSIWKDLERVGFSQTTYPYNEIIMALAKRKDYAEEAVILWRKMQLLGIPADTRSFNGALTACSRLGDLALAKEVLGELSIQGIEMDETKYSLVLKTYAKACSEVTISEQDTFIQDSWLIYQEAVSRLGQPTIVLLNSLLEVHCSAHREHEVEGLVLPLYEGHGLVRTMHTYRSMIRMYDELNSPEPVYNLWEVMKAEGVKPDIFIMNSYLRTTIKDNKLDRVLEVLEMMGKEKKMPKYKYLAVLREVKNMPYRLWMALQPFKDHSFRFWNKKRTYNVMPKRYYDAFTR
mmetsp:Transcript_16513/g.29763  ORF Transcript_16513/g.29763 Transcript_16513/m.29763 type:complete len:538 (-) Transcript_16513:35-1648(-)